MTMIQVILTHFLAKYLVLIINNMITQVPAVINLKLFIAHIVPENTQKRNVQTSKIIDKT